MSTTKKLLVLFAFVVYINQLSAQSVQISKEDLIALANHFLKFYSDKYFKTNPELSPKALDKLMDYHYPGNVRELQYIIERAVIMADSEVLQPNDLLFSPLESGSKNVNDEDNETKLSAIEKQTILRVIDKNNGNSNSNTNDYRSE